MSELRLHLDEDAEAHALVRALRGRGVDVTTTSEAGLSQTNDEALLAWVSQQNRVILTSTQRISAVSTAKHWRQALTMRESSSPSSSDFPLVK